MRATLARGDNQVIQNYSDKLLVSAKDFMDHTNVQTPVPLTLFITLAREGKPNKVNSSQEIVLNVFVGDLQNNVKDYFAKINGKSPTRCPVLAEAMLLTYRHDLLEWPAPNFNHVEYNRADQDIRRRWYNDKFFCILSSSSSDSGGSSSPLARPYTIDAMYANWSRSFTVHEISSLHVCHLPRVLETFVHLLEG